LNEVGKVSEYGSENESEKAKRKMRKTENVPRLQQTRRFLQVGEGSQKGLVWREIALKAG
jgi:hypothetical protein